MVNSYTEKQELWRYDLTEPPSDWDMDYHNVEYMYPNAPDSFKLKNQINAFFFYEDKSQAFLTGSRAAQNRGLKQFWLTQTTIIPTLSLLDLRKHKFTPGIERHHDFPLQVIARLEEIGIHIISDSYLKFNDINGNVHPFSCLKSDFNRIMELDIIGDLSMCEIKEKLKLADNINTFFLNKPGYLGQLLTDFSNGPLFKSEILSRGWDGYMFEEEYLTKRATLCIFDSHKLTKPRKELVYVH